MRTDGARSRPHDTVYISEHKFYGAFLLVAEGVCDSVEFCSTFSACTVLVRADVLVFVAGVDVHCSVWLQHALSLSLYTSSVKRDLFWRRTIEKAQTHTKYQR